MRRWFLIVLAVLPWLVACGTEPRSSVSAQPAAEEPPGSVPVDEEATGGPVAAADVQGDEDAVEACQAIHNYQGANLAAAFTSDAGTIRHWDGPGADKMPEGHAYHIPKVIKGKPDDTVAYACYLVDDQISLPGPPEVEIMGVIVIADNAGGSDTWLGIVKEEELVFERPAPNYERSRGDS